MRDWTQDKAWADEYLPEIERAIRSVAGEIVSVSVASDDRDRQEATDYIVKVTGGDIACRVRKWHYWRDYGDVTLRYSRPSGIETEVQKIRRGYGRWYLYAWARPSGEFGAWVFVDLDALRQSGLLEQRSGGIANHNGSSQFISLSLAELSKQGCVIDAGGEASDWVFAIPSREREEEWT